MSAPGATLPVADARCPEDAAVAIDALVTCHNALMWCWWDGQGNAPPPLRNEDVAMSTFVLAGAPALPGLPDWLQLAGLYSVGIVTVRSDGRRVGYVRIHDQPPGWS